MLPSEAPMTRPHHPPPTSVRRHVHVHHRGYSDLLVVLCTLAFLLGGAYIAVTQVLPTLR